MKRLATLFLLSLVNSGSAQRTREVQIRGFYSDMASGGGDMAGSSIWIPHGDWAVVQFAAGEPVPLASCLVAIQIVPCR